MERRMWALLAIDAGGDPGLSPVQLQKTLFLLGENCRDDVGDVYYEFVPYDYGPLSMAVYGEAKELASEGLIAIRSAPGRRWSNYHITPEGRSIAETVRAKVDQVAAQYLQVIVDWAKKLTFAELLTAIYKQYPEYKVNSIFRE